MTRDEFLAYLEDFNSGDPTRLHAHFSPDIVFENYGDRQSGPEVIASSHGSRPWSKRT